jgi:predicted HicB family RNase H-like nuclease
MAKNNSPKRDPIPKHFQSMEAAAEFWDNHDLTDYWDLTKEVKIETDIQRRVFLTALEPSLAQKLTEVAHKQGISTETLINVWLKEKVEETA